MIECVCAVFPYVTTILLISTVYAVFALGLNLEWGFTGLINFGHVAFLAIGAYTTAMLNMGGCPLVLSVVAGVVVAGLFGLLLGVPTLRLREDYLAIVTIGFSEVLRFVLLNEGWLTRGPFGIHGFDRPFQDMIPHQYYNIFLLILFVAILTIVYISLEKLVRSPWGRVLKSIREDETVPTALGKNVFSYKLQSLAIGSAIAGLAGAMLAFYLQYIDPGTFKPIETFYAWIIVILGGTASNKGTVVGALILWTLFSATKFINPYLPFTAHQMGAFRMIMIGLLLMLLMMYKPEGIFGKKEELALSD
ncbi:MAG: branched-chain amino acid ABC transporter permease [Euryarchaeota archaeon]|nr:branched-chain amino acid ABC transporter permease [Euryarchaeota archaeon]